MDSVISWAVLWILSLYGAYRFACRITDEIDRNRREAEDFWEREARHMKK